MTTTPTVPDVHRPEGRSRPAHADAALHVRLGSFGGAATLLLEAVRAEADRLAGRDHLAARVLGDLAADLSAAGTRLDLLAVARDPDAADGAYDLAVDHLTGR